MDQLKQPKKGPRLVIPTVVAVVVCAATAVGTSCGGNVVAEHNDGGVAGAGGTGGTGTAASTGAFGGGLYG